MISHQSTKALLDRVLARSTAAEAELIFRAEEQQLTRYGSNDIVQNVSRKVQSACLRIQKDGKQASTKLHHFDDAAIDKAFKQAHELLAVSPQEDDLLPIQSSPQDYRQVDAFSDEAVDHDPKIRADSIARLIDDCKSRGCSSAGRYEVEAGVEAYGNSHGLFAYHPSSNAIFSSTVTGPI